MTDLEELKNLLDKFGVGYEQRKHHDGDSIYCTQVDTKVLVNKKSHVFFIFKDDGSFTFMGGCEKKAIRILNSGE
jgi:hypothetical protein